MRFNSQVLGFTLVAMASLVKADFFANFFDDSACSVNSGMEVSIRNTGCLEEAGRGSLYMPDNGLLKDPYCLILTDSEGCNCQSDSYQLYATGECIPLANNAQSYRFVHGMCGSNNC